MVGGLPNWVFGMSPQPAESHRALAVGPIWSVLYLLSWIGKAQIIQVDRSRVVFVGTSPVFKNAG